MTTDIQTLPPPARITQKLSLLFEIRSVGDYGAMEHVAPDIAHDAVAMATEFVEAVKKLLE